MQSRLQGDEQTPHLHCKRPVQTLLSVPFCFLRYIIAFAYEKWRLAEYPELAAKIVHASLEDDTLGYDVMSFETDGRVRYVEVKATEGPLVTRFFISANEIAYAEQHSDQFLILRVGNVRNKPVCCEIRDMKAELDLKPAVFECAFKPIDE